MNQVAKKVTRVLEDAGERHLWLVNAQAYRLLLFHVDDHNRFEAGPYYWAQVQKIVDRFFLDAPVRLEVSRELIDAAGVRDCIDASEFVRQTTAEEQLQELIAGLSPYIVCAEPSSSLPGGR